VKHHSNVRPADQSLTAASSTISSTLAARYGEDALAEGYVAVPRLLLRHRRALGVTAGEWLYLIELFSYWHGEGDPYPGVERLAADLGIDASTVRRYRLALEAKGLLRVYRDGRHNRYDLRPLLAAAVARERAQEQAAPVRRAAAPAQRAPAHAEKDRGEKEKYDQDKTPCPQVRASRNRAPVPSAASAPPALDSIPADGGLAARLAAIGAELGDDTPASSLTRATNLERELGVSRPRLLEAVEAAAARVGAAAPSFRVLGADGRPNGMHYFFAVLRRQLRGMCVRPRARLAAGVPGRCASPEPPPIAEANPVWRAALEALRCDVTAQTFATWLASTRALEQTGEVLRIGVPGPLHRHWLERIAGRIGDALSRTGHAGVRVEYVVGAA
jgi:hypothetical protein